MPRDVVIVGGGPAGLAAAVWCRRLGLDTLLLEAAPEFGGQVRDWTHQALDYPGLAGLAPAELVARFVEHALAAGADLRTGARVAVFEEARPVLRLALGDRAETVDARAVILAAGAEPRPLGVPGEAEMLARGEAWRGSRDAARFAGRPVVVVGSGDRAVQNALLLAEAGALVTLVHRPGPWRARGSLLAAARRHPAVSFLCGRVTAIAGRSSVEGVRVQPHPPPSPGAAPAGSAEPSPLHPRAHGDGEPPTQRPAAGGEREVLLPAAGVFVYIGYAPRTDPLAGRVALRPDGTVPVGEDGATPLPGLYAAGDVCTPSPFRSVTTAVGQAMRAAKAVALALDRP